MSETGEAGKRGSGVRSDCWIGIEIRDSGGVDIDMTSKVAGMFGERITALLEDGCRLLGVDHVANSGVDDEVASAIHVNHIYHCEDIIYDARLVDILSQDERGATQVLYDRFHDYESQSK